MIVTRTVIKAYFQTGDKPTEAEFINAWDSFLHLSEDVKLLGCKMYDPTLTYLQGQMVTYLQVPYIAKIDILVPEAWTPAHWDCFRDSPPPLIEDVVGDDLLYSVTEGNILIEMHIAETAGNPVTIKLGSTPGGDDIQPETELTASVLNALKDLDFSPSSSLPAFDIYISSDDWNGASLDCYVTLKRLF